MGKDWNKGQRYRTWVYDDKPDGTIIRGEPRAEGQSFLSLVYFGNL